MEIRDYLQIGRRWAWLIVLSMVLGGSGAYLASRVQEPVYRATTVLLVNEGDVATEDTYAGMQTGRRLAESYVERLKSPDILEAAAAGIGGGGQQLQASLQVRLIGSTQLIELSVEHTQPALAKALADAIPLVFSERNEAQQLERYAESKASLERELAALAQELKEAELSLADAQEGEQGRAAAIQQLQGNVALLRETHASLLQSYEDVRIAEASSLSNIVVDTATRVSRDPVRPRTTTNVVLGTVVAVMLAVGFVLLVEYLDNTVKSTGDLERMVGAPALGAIAEMPVSTSQPEEALVVAHSPRSPAAEAYRQLRTNLMYSLVSRNVNTILVTSANPGEGKSVTAANLALALVQAGKRVIVVDADLRMPSQHRLFGVPNRQGLTDLILEPAQEVRLLRPTIIPDLHVLPSGALPPNPSELLGSERMRQVAAWLAGLADYVIYDSPPTLPVTDAAVLSRFVDTTVLVVRAGATSVQAVTAAWENLRAVESHVAGIVLNGIRHHTGYDGYYYRSANGDDVTANGSGGWRANNGPWETLGAMRHSASRPVSPRRRDQANGMGAEAG